jgi:hypothetical protein
MEKMPAVFDFSYERHSLGAIATMIISSLRPRYFFRPLRSFLILATLLASNLWAHAADWQWSVPVGNGRAFLWIPSDCRQVRAVVVGQQNMIEQGILEHPHLRKTLSDLHIAEIWISPPFDGIFHFDQGAGDQFSAIMKALAAESGYGEIEFAPVIPLAHSACASYPWNFAAWNPGRTLAILSVHGDAPQTNRTGSGKPNPDWGDRNIDGVPGLMVMGEYEWSDDRLQPALDFEAKHPQAPVAMLAEPGSGHYNYNDRLIDFLGMFIRKAVAARLPAEEPLDRAPVLKPVDPKQGWLVERWYLNKGRTVPPAPYASYTGGRAQAFWCFDEEMARAIQDYSADQPGKLPQLISVTDGHIAKEAGCGEPVNLHFYPDADGVTFHLQTSFLDVVPGLPKNGNPARWAYLPAGTPLGHATGGGPIVIHKVVGPVTKISDDTFALQLDRNAETKDKRLLDFWLWVSHPGDAKYKAIVQPAVLHLERNTVGADQQIAFPEIADRKVNDLAKPDMAIPLQATSDSGLPVSYYVREGPAHIDPGAAPKLVLDPIPPRSRFPLKVTVVAWQWGRSAQPPVKTALPVEHTFSLTK